MHSFKVKVRIHYSLPPARQKSNLIHLFISLKSSFASASGIKPYFHLNLLDSNNFAVVIERCSIF